MKGQLIGCVLHIIGDHCLCEHEELGDRLYLKCQGQVSYFAKVLKNFEAILLELITDFGVVDVNVAESFNPTLAKTRSKVKSWTVNANAFSCMLANLQWQKRKFYFWGLAGPGGCVHPELRIIEALHMTLVGCDLHFSVAQLKTLNQELTTAVKDNERNDDHERLEYKARARAKHRARPIQLLVRPPTRAGIPQVGMTGPLLVCVWVLRRLTITTALLPVKPRQ